MFFTHAIKGGLRRHHDDQEHHKNKIGNFLPIVEIFRQGYPTEWTEDIPLAVVTNSFSGVRKYHRAHAEDVDETPENEGYVALGFILLGAPVLKVTHDGLADHEKN